MDKTCKQPIGIEMAKYFPCSDDVTVDWNQLRIHDVGKYSISRPDDAEDILRTIVNVMNMISGGSFRPDAATIVDGTACVGGDSISFARVFKKVTSVERDPDTFRLLANNLGVYGLLNTKVHPINADLMTMLSDAASIAYNCDVLYMDPPWNRPGQPWHSQLKTLMLYLGATPIDQVVQNVLANSDLNRRKKPHMIVVKCPGNFDLRRFVKALPDVAVIVHPVKSFLVLMCINPHFMKRQGWSRSATTTIATNRKASRTNKIAFDTTMATKKIAPLQDGHTN